MGHGVSLYHTVRLMRTWQAPMAGNACLTPARCAAEYSVPQSTYCATAAGVRQRETSPWRPALPTNSARRRVCPPRVRNPVFHCVQYDTVHRFSCARTFCADSLAVVPCVLPLSSRLNPYHIGLNLAPSHHPTRQEPLSWTLTSHCEIDAL